MAVTLRGTASGSDAAAADVTVTLPAGIAQNDVVYGTGVNGGNVGDLDMAMVTTGYTELADLFVNDTNDTNLGLFRKVMGATPDSTAVFSNLATNMVAVVEVLIGVDTGTPEDATTTTAAAASFPAVNSPSITTVTANAWVISVGGTTEPDVPTAPTNYINLIHVQGVADNVMMATREIASPGAENPALYTGLAGQSTDSWAAATVAVRPATGAPPEGQPTMQRFGGVPGMAPGRSRIGRSW